MLTNEDLSNTIKIYEKRYDISFKMFDDCWNRNLHIDKKVYLYFTLLGLYFVVLTLFVNLEFKYFFPFRHRVDYMVLGNIFLLFLSGLFTVLLIAIILRVRKFAILNLEISNINTNELNDLDYIKILQNEAKTIYEHTMENRPIIRNKFKIIKIVEYFVFGISIGTILLLIIFLFQLLLLIDDYSNLSVLSSIF